MIDLPTQSDLATPHHRKAIGALVATVVVFGVALIIYFVSSNHDSATPIRTFADFVGQPVPSADLTVEQTEKLKELVGSPVLPANLTAEQMEQLKELQSK